MAIFDLIPERTRQLLFLDENGNPHKETGIHISSSIFNNENVYNLKSLKKQFDGNNI